MEFDFVKHRESQNLIPIELNDKKQYYHDLMNIEYSWTGRIDAQIGNTFFRESVQLIINAIALFEMGYFDCAFYSLRQCLEVSTTVIYLIDSEDVQKEDQLLKWKSQSQFPMYSRMLKMLEDRKAAFADVKSKMASYFTELDVIKNKLNKHVHKQGFNNFYVARSNFKNRGKSQEQFITDFEVYLNKCIGAVAVFRLAIDPMPVLLGDEDIYNRTGQFMTEAYSSEFMQKYIGAIHIEAYKNTDLYKSYYEAFISNEVMLPSVIDLVKNEFVDKEKIDEILSQKHLISQQALLATLLITSNEKIAKVYCNRGFLYYFSSTESIRQSMSYNSQDFDRISQAEEKNNIPYDEAYLTCLKIADEEYIVEHNDKFMDAEISELLVKLQNAL